MTQSGRPGAAGPLRIRGHHLLCALGFRGRGYSEAFVANMDRIVRRMRARPRTRLLLLDSADSICAACPNLRADGACRNKKASARICAKDRAILRRLDLKPGAEISAASAYGLVRQAITPSLLTEKLCVKCRWRSLGYCAEGLERLSRAVVTRCCPVCYDKLGSFFHLPRPSLIALHWSLPTATNWVRFFKLSREFSRVIPAKAGIHDPSRTPGFPPLRE